MYFALEVTYKTALLVRKAHGDHTKGATTFSTLPPKLLSLK